MYKSRISQLHHFIFVFAAYGFLVPAGHAATVTWKDAATTTDWFTTDNWIRSPAGFPAAGDNIYIGNNTTEAASTGDVSIGPGTATGSNLYLGYAPDTAGTLTVTQGAGLTLSSIVTIGSQGTGSLKINGGIVSAARVNDGYYNGTAAGVGHLVIMNGGVLNTTSSGYSYIGYARNGAVEPSTVNIDGSSSQWNSNGGVIIGAGSYGSGTVTVKNGGILNISNPLNSGSNMGLGLADGVNARGNMTISGQGSKVIATPGITVGIAGVAHMSVLDGAVLESSSDLVDYDYIGQTTTLDGVRAEGHVVVDGKGSSWINATGLVVGLAGTGTMMISHGASVSSGYDSYIGITRGSISGQQALYAGHGEVTITDPGSIWTTATLDIAQQNGADGILTVSKGGRFKTTKIDGIRVGLGGHGIINIGAPSDQSAVTPGYIESDNILLVKSGNSELNFNHTATVADNYQFSPFMSGEGTVNVMSGVTAFTGENSYSGPTTISGGVLKAGSGRAFSPDSDFLVHSGGTLDVNGISQTVNSLTNAGYITMGRGTVPGTTLVVTGDYTGDGGTIAFNTVLNDDNSATDKLIVNGNTSGNSLIAVNNIGGKGANTIEGIEIVEVRGDSGGMFAKAGRIVAGGYDYNVEQKGKNWYLTNLSVPVEPVVPPVVPPVTPPVVPPVTPPNRHEQYRPEFGSYLANNYAANTLFITRLHDRLGETQYTDVLTGEKKVTSLWMRNTGGHQSFRDNSSSLKTTGNRYVLQIGGDLAQWSTNELDRWHLGVMAGYANSRNHTTSGLTDYYSRGQIAGYSLGVYGTWYLNDAAKSGTYVDVQALYNWFDNKVTGQYMAAEKYKSSGITASVETGYSLMVGESEHSSYWIQPKAQLVWMGVEADDHREKNGTLVKDESKGNLLTRLGVKAYITGYNAVDAGKDRTFQPFIEANWLHNSRDSSVQMDELKDAMSGTKNIFEVKAGVEGQLNKNFSVWGNIAQQAGNNNFSDTQGMFGVKYSF